MRLWPAIDARASGFDHPVCGSDYVKVDLPVSRFFNTLGHLGRGKIPYGDVGVVITLSDPA